MSTPDNPTGSDTLAVVRQPVQSAGIRRLSGLQGAAAPSATASATSSKDALRAAFAEELAMLEAEARQRGLASAREEVAKALATAQQEQARQWQAKENTLRQGLEQERQRLVELTRALTEQSQRLATHMEPVVGRLALAVVLRLLGQHLVSRPLMADLAAQAVEEYRLTPPLRIRVASCDYQALCGSEPSEALFAAFQADSAAEPGSCVVDFGQGQLDVGLEALFAALKQALLQVDHG